ncbi:hypothetical protein GCM10025768_15650 [Microbacterium pseudoresistens]|uniref:DUF4245 domain-containing protein n=1 Tax=Microbacterium pseudoresistens TaxID=640634 RepID=A0A7Y9ESD3_9MICO|nr:DUF4245 family protein [Microbacterium pseudoresistens]NYD53083.1 hypothetical protein [Microbacterium pseudoresistens]
MTRESAPIVAELGRPETAEETAGRKAAASAAYRSSQTFRSLIAALIVTVGLVAIIVFIVPRGEPATPASVDVAAAAANVESSLDRAAIVPDLGDEWRANGAVLEGGSPSVWTVTLAPAAEDERGFVRLAQAFDAEASWAATQLKGASPTGTVNIDGRDWDEYSISHPDQTGNISYAIGIQAGADYILLAGSRSATSTAQFAATLTAQIDRIANAEEAR